MLDSLLWRPPTVGSESVQSVRAGHPCTALVVDDTIMGPLGALTADTGVAGAEDSTAPSTPGLHTEGSPAPGQHAAPHPLQLSLAHGRRHRAVLARHGPGQR